MIAYIEFDSRGKPCRIVRMRAPAGPVLDQMLEVVDRGHRLSEEDVNWSDRDQCSYRHEVGSWMGRIYLHQLCGDGPPHKIWLHPDASCSHASGDGEPLSDAEIEALGYELLTGDKPSLAPYALCEGSTYYCERCNDNLPDDDACEHVFWCNTCGMQWDKRSEASECGHYCDECEVELHYGDCDRCRELPSEAA